MVRVSLEIGAGARRDCAAEVQPRQAHSAAKAGHASPYLFDLALPVRSDATMASPGATWRLGCRLDSDRGGFWPRRPCKPARISGRCWANRLTGGFLFCGSRGRTHDHPVQPDGAPGGMRPRPGIATWRFSSHPTRGGDAEVGGRSQSRFKAEAQGKSWRRKKPSRQKIRSFVAVMKSILGGDVAHSALTVKMAAWFWLWAPAARAARPLRQAADSR